jgi:hypothetical protein
MRIFIATLFAGFLLSTIGASAAQQLGDFRTPNRNGCPVGMVRDQRLNACVAQAANGCCAPNPQRAVCVNAAPGQARWQGNPNYLRNGAVICPR